MLILKSIIYWFKKMSNIYMTILTNAIGQKVPIQIVIQELQSFWLLMYIPNFAYARYPPPKARKQLANK